MTKAQPDEYAERKASLFRLYSAAMRLRKWGEAYGYMAQIEAHAREYEGKAETGGDSGATPDHPHGSADCPKPR